MEKICLENLISGLMFVGFDKVDSLLLEYSFEELMKQDLHKIQLGDVAIPSLYNYVEFVDGSFKLKNNYDLDDDIKLKNDVMISVRKILALHSNKRLIECLKRINYKDIVLKKISRIGVNNLSSMNNLFSSKEKEIIMNIFGITLDNSKVLRK